MTSNRSIDGCIPPFDDPILAQSALDRLAHNTYQVVIESDSFRNRQRSGEPQAAKPLPSQAHVDRWIGFGLGIDDDGVVRGRPCLQLAEAIDTPDGRNPIEGVDGAQKPRHGAPSFASSETDVTARRRHPLTMPINYDLPAPAGGDAR